METTPREQVLKRVRQALMEKTRNPYPNIDLDSNIYVQSGEDPVVDFAENFTAVGGQFIYCTHKFDAVEQLLKLSGTRLWSNFFCREAELLKLLEDTGLKFTALPAALANTDAVISGCEAVLPRSGSLVVSGLRQPRLAITGSSVHIVIAFTSKIRQDLKEVFKGLKQKNDQRMPKWVSVITGPSRTADIEKIPVIGVHGPRELICFLIEDRKPDQLQKLYTLPESE